MQEANYGVLFALLGANYQGMTPEYIYERLTWPQVRMYLGQIPYLEFRRHYPLAKTTAAMLNMGGGKPRPGRKSDPDFEPWSPHELLVSYARLEDEVFQVERVSPHTANEFLRLSAAGLLPSWVLATANLAEIWSVAGQES